MSELKIFQVDGNKHFSSPKSLLVEKSKVFKMSLTESWMGNSGKTS